MDSKRNWYMAKPWIIASFHPAFLMRQPEQKNWLG